MIDDEKIIEMFFNRDQQAIHELDMKHGKIFRNLSYNVVNSRLDAENVSMTLIWVHGTPFRQYIPIPC